jgi:hypothetical protein
MVTPVGNNFDPQLRWAYNRRTKMKVIVKKVIGVIFIIVGLAALLTPLTPGSWLALIGLELLGVRLLFINKLLKEKHRAAINRFTKKFGITLFPERTGDTPDKKEG